MGRHGPLTSQALGRSPYDDVVEGLGEADPHEPPKQYDEKGRIVNPQTKQTIKDIIRAHNEVMLVIGVAEPENPTISNEQDALSREHNMYESDTGKTLLNVGRCLGILGIWGVHGTRQRVLLYREYNQVSFWDLWKYERKDHSVAQICFMGLPSFIAMQVLRWSSLSVSSIRSSKLFRSGLAYVRFHFHLFLTLQRLGLIPASRWLPDPQFLIPFSNSSPFMAPPLGDTSISGMLSWANGLAANLAPFAAFYLCGRLWSAVHIYAWPHVIKLLPRPSQNERYSTRVLNPTRNTPVSQPVLESPTLGETDREIRHTQNPDTDIPTLMALDGQPTEEALPVGSIRRQSTFSSRGGEDYGTDEEDAELVNPTLISFDVDTSETTADHNAGIWSAELRPSVAADSRVQAAEDPVYMVNPLTQLPSILGADILTNFVAYVACTPTDALALRGVARAFTEKRGLPQDRMFDSSLWSNLSLRGVVNIVGLEVLRLMISGDAWALTTVVSQWLHVTEEEWKDIHKGDPPDGGTAGDASSSS